MATQKITDLPDAVALTPDDVFLVVDNPAGTPSTRKASLATLQAVMPPGPQGVAGPAGPQGVASTVAGPTGPAGAAGLLAAATAGDVTTGTSTTLAVTPAALSALNARYAPLNVVDVRSHGAVGDGVADDSAAIQAAIDAASARSTGTIPLGTRVVFGQGTYKLASTIQVNQQALTIEGTGPDTIIKWAGAAGSPMFRVLDSSRVRFVDMTILGNTSAPPSVGIYFETPTIPTIGTNEYCSVERVMFGRRWTADTGANGSMDVGVKFGGAAIGNNDTWRIRDSQFHDCTVYGAFIENEQARWGIIDNCLFAFCGMGIRSEGSFQAVNLACARNTVADFQIKDGHVIINGYWSEQSRKLWIQLDSSTLEIYGGEAFVNAPMIGNPWYGESFVAGTTGGLLLKGLRVYVNGGDAGTHLRVYGSSSVTTPCDVTIHDCILPNGASDSGYELGLGAQVTPLNVDIRQGTYWRRERILTTPTVSSFILPSLVGRWKAGYFYGTEGTKAAFACVVDREYAVPIQVPRSAAIDQICVTTTVVGGAGAVARLGIRADSGFGTPGALILDAGTVAVDGAAGDKSIAINTVLAGPLVWLTCSTQGGTAATYRTVGASPLSIGDSTAANAGGISSSAGYQALNATGALPASYTVSGSAGQLPRVYVRAA